jgi:hypothetical protein
MWLNVSAGGKTGWVFKAMIAEKQPEPEKTTASPRWTLRRPPPLLPPAALA